MSKQAPNSELKSRWESVIQLLTEKFSDAEKLDVEGVLFLIGLQEFGKPHQRFRKEDNINLIHIGICTVLEPYGYYRFDFYANSQLQQSKL